MLTDVATDVGGASDRRVSAQTDIATDMTAPGANRCRYRPLLQRYRYRYSYAARRALCLADIVERSLNALLEGRHFTSEGGSTKGNPLVAGTPAIFLTFRRAPLHITGEGHHELCKAAVHIATDVARVLTDVASDVVDTLDPCTATWTDITTHVRAPAAYRY